MPDDVLLYILNMLPHDWVAEPPPPPARGAAALLGRLLAATAEPAEPADAADGEAAAGAERPSEASGRPVVVKARAFGRRIKHAAGRAMRRLFST